MEESRPRLVIVDPGYASTVGHHGEVNRPLLSRLSAAGWRVALWADVALEAAAAAPPGVVGAFSGCGYGDLHLGRELGGLVVLARRLEQQLALASAVERGEPVAAWLGHSLLPFQLLGLARHLAVAPAAQVLVSLMFPPGETLEEATALESSPASEQATGNTRVALAALARACRQQGHRLTLAFPSRQQEEAYGPLFAATGLSSAGVHPAVVGGGCRAPAWVEDPPLVLLHWGDQKPGKGRREALAVLEALLAGPVPEALRGYGWLFQVHGHGPLPEAEEELLQRAEAAGFGLVVLRGAVASEPMVGWLARCPLALLAYDPVRYRLRSSGVLWHWGASRAAVERPAAAVGYGGGWLAKEAAALGLGWYSTDAIGPVSSTEGEAWLEALVGASTKAGSQPTWSPYARAVLVDDFSRWCNNVLVTE